MPPENQETAAPETGRTQPMQHGHRPSAATAVPETLVPPEGWHVLHLFYAIDRRILASLTGGERQKGRDELLQVLHARSGERPVQMQVFAVPGHKADFGIMMADADLQKLHGLQVALEASLLGPALRAAYSFYSLTEVSEYVPSPEEYGRILREREGVDPESASYKTKVESYAKRLEPMNRQRLYPDFPNWPCLCFYPMSKTRQAEQNWYLLPFETRAELMSQHGRSGMKFAGKVTQLITASTGIDDWEWGVTLWGRNPAYLKDIVYAMRFDESSARYALFGAFYFGYILPPAELIETVRL